MSYCVMMMLSIIAIPSAIFGGVLLFSMLRAFVQDLRRKHIFPELAPRRLLPALGTAMFIGVIGLGIGHGWRTSEPCGGAKIASVTIPVVVAMCESLNFE